MSNIVVLFAFVCTLSVQRLLVAGNVRGQDIESPTRYFVMVTETGSGRRQTVVSWGGFLAVEDTETRSSPERLYAHQMTNGQDMLLLIFKGSGNLVSCERSEGDVVQVAQFRERYTNVTGNEVEDESELTKVLERHPEIDSTLVNWDVSMKSCVRLQAAKQEAQRRKKFAEAEFKRKNSQENETKSRSRSRRWLMLFVVHHKIHPLNILPGTTWCGAGNVSKSNDVAEGRHRSSDWCCREHDMCNKSIEGFSKKYDTYNPEFNTISDCECDDRFFTCLREAKNDHSNMVGNLFFNVICMHCLDFDWRLVCVENNWWGGCKRSEKKYSAIIRKSGTY